MDEVLPRVVAAAVRERLGVMPVVVLMGPRQAGKSTVARTLSPPRTYRSLDDLDVQGLARQDPQTLIEGAGPLTLDEIQREPNLLHAVKGSVDETRTPGRFLLTGSAHLLLMEKVSESLAGRASYLTMWPMTRREQLGLGACGPWEAVLTGSKSSLEEVFNAQQAPREDWKALAVRGGFPTPAVHMSGQRERQIWFDGYIRTYLERDVQSLSNISSLPDFRRLMRAICLRLGQLVNQSELGRDVGMPQPTVHRYLNLLETSFVLVRLPAFASNRTKRLIKSPKSYWSDTGVALALTGGDPGGAHLENLVLNDLLVWRDSRSGRADLFYWRTTTGAEVDLVIECEDRLLPIEVKSSSRPRVSDTKHLRSFIADHRDRCQAGLLLHDGPNIEWLTSDVLAVPWWKAI